MLFVTFAQSTNMQVLVNVNVNHVVLDLNPLLLKTLVSHVLQELIPMVMEDVKIVQMENTLLLKAPSNVTLVVVVVKL